MTDRKLRALGQVYLQIQRSRVGVELQMQKLEEQELIKRGFAKKKQLTEQERASHDYKKTELIITDEVMATIALRDLKASKEYKVLEEYNKNEQAEELRFLAAAEERFSDSKIWEFCEHVKGLGPVAALTFFTVLDTEAIIRVSGEGSRVITAGKVNKYLGLVPGQRLQAGKLGGFNTLMKGRTWVLSRNVIMANDSYYAEIYRIEKEFYRNRPDLIAEDGFVLRCPHDHFVATQQKEGDVFCPGCKENYDLKTKMAVISHKKKPAWKKWINAMAARWMRKILLSHATEIIAVSEGYEFSRHSNYIPPKPKLPVDQEAVLERFRQERIALLDKYVTQFTQTGNALTIRDNMLSYWTSR